MTRLLSLEVRSERDVVLARQRTRQVAGLFGFDGRDQVRLATAVSEVARNAVQHAGGGRVEYAADGRRLRVTVRDHGPGIPDATAVFDGRGPTAAGGLVSARRLIDDFDVSSPADGGTLVRLGRELPAGVPPPTGPALARAAAELAKTAAGDATSELQNQNQELLRALADLRDRETRLGELNRELEETNRGVVALYAELEEKADSLKRVSDLKTRFLSNMSHEFRTPLNSILSLSQFLLDRADGPLTDEQQKQVTFIRRAAHGLSELVNDLLDLAKVEAGKVAVRPEPFRAADLFAALRGMMRPLLTNDAVALAVDDPPDLADLHTDEGKVAQVLRNFVSNALKFTDRGEVRVSAAAGPGDTVVFAVADSGIGIAAADQARIFEEFGQIESAVQRKVKGTGLGLPLSRRLAELLGGHVWVRSEPGAGSTFYLSVPRVYAGPADLVRSADDLARRLDPGRTPVLVVEDDPTAAMLYERYLQPAGFQVFTARTSAEARAVLAAVRPAAIVLDILLESESGWELLAELKAGEGTRDIPVVVVTVVDGHAKAAALGAHSFSLKPVERDWLVRTLKGVGRPAADAVLIVDDDEIARYVLRGLLDGSPFRVLEAAGGVEGLRRAREDSPRAVFLDLVMPDLSGFDVLDGLKADPATRGIPVIVYTSSVLDAADRERLAAAAAVLSKVAAESRELAAREVRDALTRAGVTAAGTARGGSRG